MKNYEKYAEEIKDFDCEKNFCKEFVKPRILNSSNCNGIDCRNCHMLQTIWLLEDYEEPEVDWSKMEVDTPILVRDTEYEDWYRRYFAEYKDGVVYAWTNGRTGWSANNCKQKTTPWEYAKLAESEYNPFARAGEQK